jgi:hypothetical protein
MIAIASALKSQGQSAFLGGRCEADNSHRKHEHHSSSSSCPSPPTPETRAAERASNGRARAGPSQCSSSPSRTLPIPRIRDITKPPLVKTRGFVVTNPSPDESSSPTDSDPPWTPPPVSSTSDFTPQAFYVQIPEWPEYARPAAPPAFATPIFYAAPSPLPLATCAHLPPEPSETQGVIPKLPQQQKSWPKMQTGPASGVWRKH